MNLKFAVIAYQALRERIRSQDPSIDNQTLAEAVEQLTDVNEILTAVIRSALSDEALASGLKVRIGEMEERLERLQNRASKRRQIAKVLCLSSTSRKLRRRIFPCRSGRALLPCRCSMRPPSQASTGSPVPRASNARNCSASLRPERKLKASPFPTRNRYSV